ncbi:histidine phosphatase family protein [Algihabitans albus]|uniref:histidine phosphatase family protein n=1 Tax=Algihabitans albus TaxID=2164067 RepID=UPI0013C36A94|nr:histidine phosphatase family protein [Algihabitans albus]
MTHWQPPRVPFVFLRHGETDWNRDGRLQGRRDPPLNETGRRQARQARRALMRFDFSTVFHSPLDRAYETAQLAAGGRGLPLCSVNDLVECDFGELEGQAAQQLRPGWRAAWMAGQTLRGAETYAAFLTRAQRALEAVLRLSSDATAPPLIVAHGGVYWAVQRALDTGFEGDLPNALPVLHRPCGAGDWEVTALAS